MVSKSISVIAFGELIFGAKKSQNRAMKSILPLFIESRRYKNL
ncbi:hypothetical protein LEP1GSC165_0510 [Leptospira santarosai str. CBC523]|nr:hypothetical protein LEP1GSC165_0510 [Leptospira santarosai str. CBC523]